MRGHEAQTVVEGHLGGASDQTLFEICVQEGRCLVSLDMDFADVVRFPPLQTKRIVVIHPPKTPSSALLRRIVSSVLDALTHESIEGRLWIAEPNRIRVHEPREN
jgi:predicted nuclease of predicted toxin-antitoxin system